jgi:hypothetical protein
MNHATVLRSMIEQREREIAALRDALEMMEAVDGQTAELDAAPASDQGEKINTPPTLYGEDGRVDDRPVTTRLREFLAREHPAGCRLTNKAIARAAGLTEKQVADSLMGLKRQKLARVLRDETGRIIHAVPIAAAPEPMPEPAVRRVPDPPKPSAPVIRTPVGPVVTRDARPAATAPAVPYAPPATADTRRAEEQAAVARFLAEKGAKRFEGRAGLLTLLERAFAEEGITIEEAHDLQAKRKGTPYRLAGKLVTTEHAIRRADAIRKRQGLAPIGVEVGEGVG